MFSLTILKLNACSRLENINDVVTCTYTRGRDCLHFTSTCFHHRFLVGSMLLIFLVFCVVFWWGSMFIFLVFCVVVFGGVCVAHLFSFLCCVFVGVRVAPLFCFLCCVFSEVCVDHRFSFLCCVFCGVRVAHLFSFLCCVLVGSVLIIFLVFCVVFWWGPC